MKQGASNIAVKLIEVDDESAGQRIDNFLFTRLKGVPKSHIYRILRTGEVRRNGGRIQARDRLDSGDLIRIPPIRSTVHELDGIPEAFVRARLESRILYEDSELLVLNKPAGMAVHGGSGISFGVIEGLREIRSEARFLELVHRLDRDTSGCLLIAKKRSALRTLHEQFRNDNVKKVYLALLAGTWARTRCIVDAPLKRSVLQGGERIVKVAREGKPAVTEFRRLECYVGSTLVEARPVTGRTHQIRVHAQSMGHPIVGDDRYGDEKVNRESRRLGLKRLFLHALETVFLHPRTGEALRVKAPIDQDLSQFLKTSLP